MVYEPEGGSMSTDDGSESRSCSESQMSSPDHISDDAANGVTAPRCSVTLEPVEDPCTSRECRHVFEKEVVLQYIRYKTEKRLCVPYQDVMQ